MTAATEDRWRIVRWLCDRLAGQPVLSGVAVWPAWPGDAVTSDMIWVDELTGDLNIPVATGATSRHPRDDNWQAPILIRTAGTPASDPLTSVRACGDRLFTLCAAVENLLADDPGLGDQSSVVDAELVSAAQQIVMTPEGPIGFAQLNLSIHSRLD